jgi:hypothetical protein
MMHQLEDRAFVARQEKEIDTLIDEWKQLGSELKQEFDLSFEALDPEYAREHHEWMYRSGWQGGVPERVIVGDAHSLLEVDMKTVTHDELFGWSRKVSLPGASAESPVHGLCVWFDVDFCAAEARAAQETLLLEVEATGGAKQAPPRCVQLTTSPLATPTHWGQTALFLSPELAQPQITVSLTQSDQNHHNLNVTLRYEAPDAAGGEAVAHYSVGAEIKGYELMSGEGQTDEVADEEAYEMMRDEEEYSDDMDGAYEE